jgi:ABC-type transport system involved in multi-copper enzyme maturation permease subunit
MNILKAEMFRYRKSTYSIMTYIVEAVFTVLVAAFLYYVCHGVSAELLAAVGLSEESIEAISTHMSGFSYMVSALSSADVLMLLATIPITIHISDDYMSGTVRTIQQKSSSRTACYITKMLAACLNTLIIYIEYIIISLIISLTLFGTHNNSDNLSQILLTLITEALIITAFTSFIYMLTTLIHHHVLSMTLNILLVFLLTPGLNLLAESLNFSTLTSNLWIISMLTSLSNMTITIHESIKIIIVSIIYIVISTFIGIRIYKKQRI